MLRRVMSVRFEQVMTAPKDTAFKAIWNDAPWVTEEWLTNTIEQAVGGTWYIDTLWDSQGFGSSEATLRRKA